MPVARVILNPYAGRWSSRQRWPAAEAALRELPPLDRSEVELASAPAQRSTDDSARRAREERRARRPAR